MIDMHFLIDILLVLAAIVLVFIVSLISYKQLLKSASRIKTPNGISSLEKIVLGNIKQWIFIRGEDQNNPVLIFLHGGPGEPAFGMSSSRSSDERLIKHFTVVHWDQRGAGKSYCKDIPPSSMTLDRLSDDCNELIDYLRERFDIQKVFIVGHSGGTLIGLKTAQKYPEKIHAYVGVSQIINHHEQQRISYNFILEESEKSDKEKEQKAVKAIGPPPYESVRKDHEKGKHIVRYGGMIHDKTIRRMMAIWFNYLTSPEYSLLEGIRTIRGIGHKFTMDAMWEEIKEINFPKEIQSMNVPIYFFVGKYDMIAPTAPIEHFYNTLEAENGKELVTFENSAHFLMIEEQEKYYGSLIDIVLKESQEK